MSAAPKLQRDRAKHLKPGLARAGRLARDAAGMSQRQLAAVLELQRAHVARMELAHEPHAPTLAHVACGPREWAEGLLRFAAQHHRLQVLREAEVVHGDDHAARLASLTVESTDVLRCLTAALAGSWSLDVLETLERELREAIEAKQEAHAWCVGEIQRRRAGA